MTARTVFIGFGRIYTRKNYVRTTQMAFTECEIRHNVSILSISFVAAFSLYPLTRMRWVRQAGSQYFFCRSVCALVKIESQILAQFNPLLNVYGFFSLLIWCYRTFSHWKERLRFDDKHRRMKMKFQFNDETRFLYSNFKGDSYAI